MGSVGTVHYRTIDEYEELQSVVNAFGLMVLFALTDHVSSTRDVIIRNSIARSLVALRSILTLWKLEDYPDCWVLHRCMMERLFQLHQLVEDDAFEVFDDWSFLQQYNKRNSTRSDLRVKSRLVGALWKDTTAEKARAKQLNLNPPQWKRPFAENVAKSMGLKPLYDYGFDHGSQFVHPMSNDGYRDFLNLTGLDDGSSYPDEIAVVHNSCLVTVVMLQKCMGASDLLWAAFARDLVDQFFEFIESGSQEYKTSFVRMCSHGQQVMSMLCEKRAASAPAPS